MVVELGSVVRADARSKAVPKLARLYSEELMKLLIDGPSWRVSLAGL